MITTIAIFLLCGALIFGCMVISLKQKELESVYEQIDIQRKIIEDLESRLNAVKSALSCKGGTCGYSEELPSHSSGEDC